jgi:hypothetical protein
VNAANVINTGFVLCFSTNIITETISRIRDMARRREDKNTYRIVVGNLKGRDHFGNLLDSKYKSSRGLL